MKQLAYVLILSFLIGGIATIQADEVDLVKMSKKEKERKKKEAKKPIVITNSNINTVKINDNKASYFSITKIETGDPNQTNVKKKKNSKETKKPGEYWKKRKTDLDQKIAKLEANIIKNEELLDELFEKLETSELSNVEGEEEEDRYDDLELRYQEAEEQIKKDKKELEKKRKELQDFLQEAKLAGVLPGWLT